MKFANKMKAALMNKVANSIMLIATFGAINSCTFLFHEDEVPEELQKDNPFLDKSGRDEGL
ncbi:cyclic lactone autoinducer peptide [Priestia filamentosa]|uniref:cyclic lactone autoinducer peptide n=1 Tax=Priestia filamentosa TaxID=1402861 RepID=UPI00030087D7|nr:cyclic lactone autoinducer peptide [Priestia filamentosa]